MKHFNFLIILTLLIIATSCSEELPDFTNSWDEDIYFFGKNLEEKHVDLFFKYPQANFENDIANLRAKTIEYTEDKLLFELAKILSKIGDSHTQLSFGNKLSVLPIELLWLDDGILLTQINTSDAAHLGKKITHINSVPILEVIESYRSIIAHENESNFKNQVVQYLKIYEFYHEFGYHEKGTEIELKLEDGTTISVLQESQDKVQFSPPSTPLFLQNTTSYYWFEEIAEENVLYIQYNSCREISTLSFHTFTEQIVDAVESNSDINKIVLDLRHNGGGNSGIMKPLIEKLEEYVEDGRFLKDNIYLIISRKTFSSALLNSFEIKDKLDNVVLGEPTGGKPNHYGEVRKFQLPKSRLNVYYSTKYFTLIDDEIDSFEPDIFIDYTSTDFLNGIDPVLDYIISN